MQEKPKVLILILNWNKKEFIIKLLNQIQNIEFDNYECLVVDNNSDDNSVAEIKSNFPEIKVLENKENLGGTGGYNSGLEYVLNNILCDYIWLIDNDAEIERNTLSSLVEVMEKDENIGIAGSRIADINRKEITVEAGSFIKWNIIGVEPHLRNSKVNKFDSEYIETDYVAICSALVRFDAFKKAGIMDERHFIFWDDMDWGLQFKKAGFKVVAVPNSVAYHPSFTERKRGIATDFYYGLRNPLLVYSKHTKPLLRLRIFHNFFRRYCMFLMLLLLNKRWTHLGFAFRAINDFVFNNWGKCNLKAAEDEKPETIELKELNPKNSKVLVIFDSYSDQGLQILKAIRKEIKDIEVYALMDNDRKEVYENCFDGLILLDMNKRKTSLIYNFQIFLKLFRAHFDFSIGSNTNPYGYSTRRYFIFNKNNIEKTGIGSSSVYKLVLGAVLGEIISIFVTPLVFAASFKYSENQNSSEA